MEGYRLGPLPRADQNLVAQLDPLYPSADDMLNRELSMDLDSAIEAEAQAQAICMEHPDFHESHAAWVEKREPKFKGE